MLLSLSLGAVQSSDCREIRCGLSTSSTSGLLVCRAVVLGELALWVLTTVPGNWKHSGSLPQCFTCKS
ncbi:hypothetical protein MHYP_G00167250 [Metynnis hypsauchen]